MASAFAPTTLSQSIHSAQYAASVSRADRTRSVGVSSTRLHSSTSPKDGTQQYTFLEKVAVSLSQTAAEKGAGDTFKHVKTPAEARALQIYTFLRVSIPSVITGVLATMAFPALSLFLCSLMNDAGTFTVLSTDSSQFVQNFLTVAGLLFSMLVGQTYCK